VAGWPAPQWPSGQSERHPRAPVFGQAVIALAIVRWSQNLGLGCALPAVGVRPPLVSLTATFQPRSGLPGSQPGPPSRLIYLVPPRMTASNT
jgi:hypothetical protein